MSTTPSRGGVRDRRPWQRDRDGPLHSAGYSPMILAAARSRAGSAAPLRRRGVPHTSGMPVPSLRVRASRTLRRGRTWHHAPDAPAGHRTPRPMAGKTLPWDSQIHRPSHPGQRTGETSHAGTRLEQDAAPGSLW